MTYGNQLDQAHRYLFISDTSDHRIDEKTYFDRFYKCYNLHRHKNGPTCMNDANTATFSSSRIWNSNRRADNHGNTVAKRLPDCKYSVQYMNARLKNSTIDFVFQIKQHSCKAGFNESGGATFMFAAFTDAKLLNCRYRDYFDNSYTVICAQYQDLITPSLLYQRQCVNLTVLLDYEHFDAYSDGLPGLTSKHFKGYNELRYTILDNQQFCSVVEDERTKVVHTSTYAVRDRVRFISGEWLTAESYSKLSGNEFYRYPNESMFSAFDHRLVTNQLTNIGSGNASEDPSLPQTIRMKSAQNLSHHYSLFHPIIISKAEKDHQKLMLSPYDDSSIYHFVGASHMRYIYDAIVAHLLSETSLNDLKAHHGFATKYNLKNYHSNIDYATILSDDQADMLRTLCSSFSSSTVYSSNVKHTIIFQTGAWDLNNSPIRRFLHDKTTGKKLVDALRDIFSKVETCPKLAHFVWVTTVPHPICFNDDEPLCQLHKGYRTNAAISAQTLYYYNNILDVNVREGLIVSVVDTFTFILPRLLLHTDTESTCLSHYHCRVRIDEYDQGKSKLALAHTPSGLATVQAVLTALTL